jgi:hypothetical protein
VSGLGISVRCLDRVQERDRVLVASRLGTWCTSNGRLGAGQSDATGQRRGTVGIGTLQAGREESKACLMAWCQGLNCSLPSCPSYHGHRKDETWIEGPGSSPDSLRGGVVQQKWRVIGRWLGVE